MPPASTTPLLPATAQRLARLFSGADRDCAQRLLEEECGTHLPLINGPDDLRIERCRCAALKLSGGDIRQLEEAVKLANLDWRDLLVAAGFANDPLAHQRWMPEAKDT
jgi:hypothetical protein